MKGVLHFCGHQTETKLQPIRVGGSDRRIFPWKFSDDIPPMDRFAGEESRARSKAVRPIESNGTPMTRPDQRLMIRDVTGLLFRAAVICFHLTRVGSLSDLGKVSYTDDLSSWKDLDWRWTGSALFTNIDFLLFK